MRQKDSKPKRKDENWKCKTKQKDQHHYMDEKTLERSLGLYESMRALYNPNSKHYTKLESVNSKTLHDKNVRAWHAALINKTCWWMTGQEEMNRRNTNYDVKKGYLQILKHFEEVSSSLSSVFTLTSLTSLLEEERLNETRVLNYLELVENFESPIPSVQNSITSWKTAIWLTRMTIDKKSTPMELITTTNVKRNLPARQILNGHLASLLINLRDETPWDLAEEFTQVYKMLIKMNSVPYDYEK